MSRHYPDGLKITCERGNVIRDNNIANDDDTVSDYEPTDDASDNSDPSSDTPDYNITSDDFIDDLYYDNATIIINPNRVDHHGPI